MEIAEDPSTERARPSKRKRIALACSACRTRKIRCDGSKPLCRPCQKRGESPGACLYTVIAQTAKHVSEQEYISSLQHKIHELNQIIGNLTDQPEDNFSPNSSLNTTATVNDGPSPVSAMGTTTAMVQNATSRNDGFYGHSSVHSLLQQVPHATNSPLPARIPVRRGSIQSIMLQAEYALPPRHVADQLLNLFFQSVHIFYPWVHSISFRARYESLWTSGGYPGRPSTSTGAQIDVGLGEYQCPAPAFFCALNAMFALGCEFSDLPHKQVASDTFGSRMRNLLHVEWLDHGSTAHVQALLLAGHYMLTTEYPNRCYNVVGLACRMAVGMGMHSDRHAKHRSAVENEIRRRVWFGCLQMEMTVCMTLGRPPLLHVIDDVNLPTAVDDEHMDLASNVCEQPPGKISRNLFMVENIKLAKILGQILNGIYCSDPRLPTSPPDFGVVVRLDSLLDDFKASLPEHLDWDRNHNTEMQEQMDLIFRRQTNVLHARFLHLRILIYRPSFSSFFASTRSSRHAGGELPSNVPSSKSGHPLSTAIRDQCAKSCVQASCALANSIEQAITSGATGAWWFSLFYLMTCGGIIILAECAQSNNRQSFDQQQLDSAWASCIKALQHLGKYHVRAQSYLEHLHSLRERARLCKFCPCT
ncbi:hypothetical protein DM02DRAFT_640994 [Periconia macrospinosa]|uniref:Zn(2)-C6 fungal-type domain-containing protein n=1 Tax=Periconia macrospinosa TaxID=97972 RepID=A0A2V1DXT5_9PLEO|nr:hypothetical protein DM02DRAFT_640994 [Periconia macrospinosa]